jgi:uncharacterized membrane protein (DUF373 family)
MIVISALLVLAFIDIVYEIIEMVATAENLIIDANDLMGLFSLFLILLIGLELIETVKAYLKEDIVHVEFIILVAIIALARKAILWDFDKYKTTELLALSAMILGLGLTYFLIKRSNLTKINLKHPKELEQKK